MPSDRSCCSTRGKSALVPTLFCALTVCLYPCVAHAQDEVAEKVKQLTEMMTRVQAQLNESQRQLEDMRQQLAALKGESGKAADPASPQAAESDAAKLAAEVEDLRERQSLQEAQIATQEQTKVESESRFPVKVSGLVLMNGFVNTRAVDMAATPTLAIPGAGSTGASVRQTIMGVDMRGPHLFGARSHGDLRVDFDGSAPAMNGYAGGDGIGLVRLRTAHAALDWENTEAFFSMDRPIVSPNVPDSLTAVAEPPLAWSGELWSWTPQFGVTQDVSIGAVPRLRVQAALIDIADAPYTSSLAAASGITLTHSTAEASRWPGVETRIAVPGARSESGLQFGVGGVFAPHRSIGGNRFDTWAGTLDYRLPLPARMQLSGGFYRGQALGGLGGGEYKDYVYRMDGDNYYFRTLDDIGGWLQWKQRLSQRLEFNEALGTDNVPAGELRPYAGAATAAYQNTARNRTATGNVIFSPSAYLLFSLEYRRIESSPVNGPTAASHVIGVAAGYKF
jgi:hypothetical protein